MYTMENGILFKNGKPQIGLGTSTLPHTTPRNTRWLPEITGWSK